MDAAHIVTLFVVFIIIYIVGVLNSEKEKRKNEERVEKEKVARQNIAKRQVD